MASRNDWCTYVHLKTLVNRRTAEQTDDFVAQMQARLEQTEYFIAQVDARLEQARRRN
jgi:hypothetical protein